MSKIESKLYYEMRNLKGLKEIRNYLGVSQNELALLTGLSQNTISSFENSVYNPTLLNAYKISYAINQYSYFKHKANGHKSIYFDFNQLFPALELSEVDSLTFDLVYQLASSKLGKETL